MTRLPRCFRHRAPLLWLLLPFALGLIFGRVTPVLLPPLWLLVSGVLLICPCPWLTHRAALWSLCLCSGLILIGTGYYSARRARLPDWESLPPREAHLTLQIDRAFFPKPGTKSFTGIAHVVQAEAHLADLVGQRLYFSATRPPGELPIRSEQIAVTGMLETLPRNAPDNTFDGYLTNLGLNFRLSRARLLASTKPPSAYRSFCERTVNRMNALLGEGVSQKRPALTAILRAMMLGQKHDLSEEQDALFMHSGTMHLFAINGLHIGVVAVSLHLFLALLRFPRLFATLITLGVLWLDVDTTGASPSAVRAFLLVASVEVAFVLRRPSNGLAALGNAALLVLIIDPLAMFSASFQMSYGVALAILSMGLPLSEYLQSKWQPFSSLPKVSWTRWHHGLTKALRWLAGALSIGWSATLVSMVTGVQFFHVFVPGAIVANLVLVPMAALVIAAGFVSIAAGLCGAVPLSFWFNHAAVFVLLGIDGLIRFATALPGSWLAANWRFEWVGPCAFSALLGLCLAGYSVHWRLKRGGFWPPFIWVSLVLLFGVKFG